jgi:RNA polymerase sigma-70 factor (ECF subfamily)
MSWTPDHSGRHVARRHTRSIVAGFRRGWATIHWPIRSDGDAPCDPDRKMCPVTRQADLTGLLQAWSDGDSDALATLVPLVHQELRELARRILLEERRDGRWRPTELVQESYLRLLDWRAVRWQNRAHFFATTARMMRRVLVDAARARRRIKRGEGIDPIPLDGIDVADPARSVDLIALEDALEKLSAMNTRASQVVELRFFGGLTVEETAETLGVSVRTVINDWTAARAWLFHELAQQKSA